MSDDAHAASENVTHGVMKHKIVMSGILDETVKWIHGVEGVRVVVVTGWNRVGAGVVIQNPDGSVAVAEVGDTLVYDNGRVRVDQ